MLNILIDTASATVEKNEIRGTFAVSITADNALNHQNTVVSAYYEATYSPLGIITVTSVCTKEDSAFLESDTSDIPTLIDSYRFSAEDLPNIKTALAKYLRAEMSCASSPLSNLLYPNKTTIGAAVVAQIKAAMTEDASKSIPTIQKRIKITADVEASTIQFLFTTNDNEMIDILIGMDMSDRRYHLSDNPELPQCNICIPLSSAKIMTLMISGLEGRQSETFINNGQPTLDAYLNELLANKEHFDRVITYQENNNPLYALEFDAA